MSQRRDNSKDLVGSKRSKRSKSRGKKRKNKKR